MKYNKKLIPVFLTLALGSAVLVGCGAKETPSVSETTNQAKQTTAVLETSLAEKTESSITLRVGSLKGATSMGLVRLMDLDSKGESAEDYEFTMVTAADELLGKVVSGDLDIALLPANVAAILYQKTKGEISVIDINTLGVLYLVSSDESLTGIPDLKGKTVYLTGKGTSPDYVLNYLLKGNGLTSDDVTLEYKSEPTEVAALLKTQPDAIGLLPQPFATVACVQNEALKLSVDLTKEWDSLQGESKSRLVTGVTIVRNDILREYPEAVDAFIAARSSSAEFSNSSLDEAADLVAAAGIIEKAPIAKKAMPFCNITSITGEEMKAALNGYLGVLFEQNPESIGGALPEDAFYYIP